MLCDDYVWLIYVLFIFNNILKHTFFLKKYIIGYFGYLCPI